MKNIYYKRERNTRKCYLGEPIEACEELVKHFNQILGAICRGDGCEANDIRIEYACFHEIVRN